MSYYDTLMNLPREALLEILYQNFEQPTLLVRGKPLGAPYEVGDTIHVVDRLEYDDHEGHKLSPGRVRKCGKYMVKVARIEDVRHTGFGTVGIQYTGIITEILEEGQDGKV